MQNSSTTKTSLFCHALFPCFQPNDFTSLLVRCSLAFWGRRNSWSMCWKITVSSNSSAENNSSNPSSLTAWHFLVRKITLRMFGSRADKLEDSLTRHNLYGERGMRHWKALGFSLSLGDSWKILFYYYYLTGMFWWFIVSVKIRIHCGFILALVLVLPSS